MPVKRTFYIKILLTLWLLSSCRATEPSLLATVDNSNASVSETQTNLVKTPSSIEVDSLPNLTPTLVKSSSSTQAATGISPTPNSPQLTPSPPNIVDQLMAEMTLEEKVGQLFMVHFNEPYISSTLETQIKEMHVGGIILFPPNIESPLQVATLIDDAQRLNIESGSNIPLFVAVDQEGWPISRLNAGFTVTPSNMALGATGSISDSVKAAQITAQELSQIGVNMNLAPVLDVNSNASNPVIGLRSFGADPEAVADLGAAVINTYQENGILATGKHFPGHGNTSFDSHFTLSTSNHSLDELWQEELFPFQRAIAEDVSVIMTAHVSYPALDDRPGIPATLSKPILSDLLRIEMQYRGLIATDSLGMGALDQQYGVITASLMAFDAGVDLLMYGNDRGHEPLEANDVYNLILLKVKQGEISETRVDESVRRILEAKAKFGILERVPKNIEKVENLVGTAQNLANAQDIARKTITLIKNDNELLPLSYGVSIALISPNGILTGDEFSIDYTSDIMEMPTSLDPSPDEVAKILNNLAKTNKDVVVLGTFNATAYPGQARLVKMLNDYQVVVVALGLPYDLTIFPNASTYLVTYGYSPPSLAVLPEILFGDTHPTGRLSVPIGDEYPIGFGISY